MNIIWLHGWGTTSEIWEENASIFLSQHTHRFIDFSHCSTPDEYIKMTEEKVSDPSISAVIGWSMGGMLAMQALGQFAKQGPLQIQKLVVLSSTLRFASSHPQMGWSSKILSRMKRKLMKEPDQVMNDFWNMALGVDAVYGGDGLRTSSLSAGLDYLMDADVTAAWQVLHEHTTLQKLWIHGTDDRVCPITAIPAGLTKQECCKIGDGGHALFLTHPELCYSQIGSFLHDH